MGPSVKFVLPIIDAFPNKKNVGNFWCGKKGHNGVKFELPGFETVKPWKVQGV